LDFPIIFLGADVLQLPNVICVKMNGRARMHEAGERCFGGKIEDRNDQTESQEKSFSVYSHPRQ
jgi:hypothetical protein